jgi:hypothetical protein
MQYKNLAYGYLKNEKSGYFSLYPLQSLLKMNWNH